jgi:phospholipid/cholesterol/gamma-HCH transport system substrate-binding protein
VRRQRLLVAATLVALVLVTGAAIAAGGDGGDGGAYRVRAVFDNASFIIPGEDVKVAGVVVGAVDSLDLTDDNKAVVVLRIDDHAFVPFRADARCSVRLQSLIGEQFVECDPTKPRGEDVAVPPPLTKIHDGAGKGEYLLPVQNTSSPVGVDLLNDIMRLPERERFRLIINEFGAGLAGNGEGLRAAIRRASPALQQADRLVSILAGQDQLLARLVDESDAVLAPLAARRRDLGDFIQYAGSTAAATAERGDDLERDFAKLPAFLRQLGPAVQRYGALAQEMGPAVANLAAQAPAVNEATQRLGSFTEASVPALKSLGDVADRGRQTFPAIEPLADDLTSLSKPLAPLARDLAALSSSFDTAGGIEALMRFIYFYTGAVNGEDAIGHYVRSAFAVSACSARISQPAPGCESTFDSTGPGGTGSGSGSGAQARSAQQQPTGQLLDYLLGSKP